MMGRYFKSWRRKIGVMTLVIACVLAVGWLRSTRNFDLIIVPGKTANYFFISGGQEFRFVSAASANQLFGANGAYDFKLIILPASFPNVVHPLRYRWTSHAATFRRAGIFLASDNQYSSADDDPPFVKMIPYWCTVVPLTLFSAWLLLGKPPEKSAIRQ
jgi:hypothetical protein